MSSSLDRDRDRGSHNLRVPRRVGFYELTVHKGRGVYVFLRWGGDMCGSEMITIM